MGNCVIILSSFAIASKVSFSHSYVFPNVKHFINMLKRVLRTGINENFPYIHMYVYNSLLPQLRFLSEVCKVHKIYK